MTAAMIRSAARVVDERAEEDLTIVSFIELGSEGAVLRFGGFRSRDDYLIARNGQVERRPQ